MNHIRRAIKDAVAEKITSDNRHVLLFGPRQTGKTTLAREIMEQLAPGGYLLLSGEDPRAAEQISSCDLSRLRGIVAGYRYVLLQELGRQVGLGTDTVISYIDLLEKACVVFRLGAFSRNLRKEISRKDKIYFFDNGVRNTLVEGEGEIRAYEFKLEQESMTAPRTFLHAYPGARFQSVPMQNWLVRERSLPRSIPALARRARVRARLVPAPLTLRRATPRVLRYPL